MVQFNVFVKSDAYCEDTWWEGLAINSSQQTLEAEPDISNLPAQWVSWYTAVAYCRWISSALGYPVRLPTEWEWQAAATGGHSDYLYPWGIDWNSNLANTKEHSVNSLVSVGLYPQGASPVGAMDMSGNLYEWCQNEFENPYKCDFTGILPRTTRGGAYFSFGSAQDAVKTTARFQDNPDGYFNKEQGRRTRVGIRLACDKLPMTETARI
ncbi:MAG: SUMF1/EgtB/PvdO family nonheme iron enzyme [Kovacikia sp.]